MPVVDGRRPIVVCGYDARESIGFHVFAQSFLETSPGLALMPIGGAQGDGSNDFTYARFRVPEMMGWAGWALWVDGSDMLCRADVGELLAKEMRDQRYAVRVVKHDYKTRHARKYVGTPMEAPNENYPRKNWSSVILWNSGHMAHFRNREAMRGTDGAFLHRFAWLKDEEIGELPIEWNHLIGEQSPNAKAKLAHFTLGVPAFEHYARCEFSDEWRAVANRAMKGAT